ncbi:MAG TPA: VRR-NUC domain-containing protein [Candidatus Tectomicrobia bacterium]
MAWSEYDYQQYLQRQGTSCTRDELENSFQSRVVRLAKDHSWLVYHTRDSRGSAEGFPDLVLVREVIIFAELKTRTGKLTAEQDRWLTMLAAPGLVSVYLWRPSDWPAIEQRLTRPWRSIP